jgi:rhodanese-related sulfurtransferase
VVVEEINVEELARRIDAANEAGAVVRLIDVREPDEYVEGHVPGAELIVLGTVPDNVDRFGGDGPAYVICRSGARSRRAAAFVAERGVEAINIAGGTLAWMASGRPVITGDEPGGALPS